MSRSHGNTTIDLLLSGGSQKLSILVENQGRINALKFLEDRKVKCYDFFKGHCNFIEIFQGILSNVTLEKHVLGPWTMTGYPLNETSWLTSQKVKSNVTPPAFYKGYFTIPKNNKHTKLLDTFLDTSGWSKVRT